MGRELEQFSELKEGACKVVVVNTFGKEMEFDGTYNSKLQTVFYVNPNNYKILGYIQ